MRTSLLLILIWISIPLLVVINQLRLQLLRVLTIAVFASLLLADLLHDFQLLLEDVRVDPAEALHITF